MSAWSIATGRRYAVGYGKLGEPRDHKIARSRHQLTRGSCPREPLLEQIHLNRSRIRTLRSSFGIRLG
jgi:hypothetical protein